ncbi:MAG: ABC transporter permease [Chloroflexota bacterium]
MAAATAARPLGAGSDSTNFGQRASRILRRFVRRQPIGTFGAIIVVVLVLTAVFAGFIAPYDPLAQAQKQALQSPSAAHLAGTDQFGRDMLSRLIYGARVSLYVGVGSVIMSVIPATIIGIMSAYFGGIFDYLVGRLTDAIQAIPPVILLIVMMSVLGVTIFNIIIALSVRSAIGDSRVMRSSTVSVSASEFVFAARSLGATNFRLMYNHILPNITSPIIVVSSLGFGRFILSESTLSFLGYGILPPAPSWGGMLASEGRAYMFAAPWMLWGPAIALSLVVFGANMFGDALRDELDPRLRSAS